MLLVVRIEVETHPEELLRTRIKAKIFLQKCINTASLVGTQEKLILAHSLGSFLLHVQVRCSCMYVRFAVM